MATEDPHHNEPFGRRQQIRSWPRVMAATDPWSEDETEILVEEEKKTKRPRMFRVLLHNDDYTTMEFVVEVLIRFFDRSVEEATHIMLQVHRGGVGVAGIYPRSIAETKVMQVSSEAERQEMPLLVTAEPEGDS